MAEQPINKNDIIEKGALESIIADFEKLINVLGKTDQAIKNVAKDTADIKPPKTTEEFAKTVEQIEKLEKAYKAQIANNEALKKAEQDLANARAEHAKLIAKKVKLHQSEENELVKLRNQINRYQKAIKGIDRDLRYGNITEAEAVRIKERLNIQLKSAQKEYKAVEKTILNLTKEQKKEQEQAKARVAMRNIEVKSLEDAVAKNKALRTILQSLDLTTAEGQLARKNLTAEIDKNTEFIKANTDSYSRQKMEVGNYTKSITTALKETGLFNTGIGVLDRTLNAILGRMVIFTNATRKQKKATEDNSKAMGVFQKSVRGVGTALKAAGIGLIIAALAGIVGMFKQGDQGAIRMAKAMNYVMVVLKVLVNALVDFGKGFILVFKGMGEQIMNIGKRFDILGLQISKAWTYSNEGRKKINDDIIKLRNEIDKTTGSATKGFALMGGAFSGFNDKIKDGIKQADLASKAFEKTFGIRREIIAVKNAVSGLNAEFEKQTALADDSTLSLEKRLIAMKKADELELQIARKAIDLARKEKALIDAEIAQNRLKFGGDNSVEDLEKLANAQLKIREAQYKIELIQINQAKVERERIIDAFETSFKLSRAVADAQRRLAEEGIQNENKSIQTRIENYERFRDVILQSTQSALKSFNDLAKSSAFGLDLDLNVNENMEIFLGDQRLAIDNAEELQKQLSKTELPDDIIEKLADYLRDFSLNEKAVRKFSGSIKDLKTELDLLVEDTEISDLELEKLIEINNKMKELVATDFSDEKGRKKILDELKKLEEERLNIQKDASMERLKLQLKEVEEQMKVAEIGSIEYEKLLKKRTDIEIQIENAKNEELKKQAKKFDEAKKDSMEQLLKDISESASNIAKQTADYVKSQQDLIIKSQENIIANSQRTIDMLKASAVAGNEQAKESILAEEKAIEEAQKRIEKAQKRKQRMELISTGINTFNSKVASGKTGLQALGETGAEMTGLITLLKALPSFDVGADRLQSNGKGIDGKGGFLAINHPDERIMTAEQNKLIGFNHKNSDIAKVMSYYNKGLLKPISDVNPVIVKQNDNSELLRSINEGFSKINNYNMSFEQLFSTFSLIIEKRKNGDVFTTKKSFKI